MLRQISMLGLQSETFDSLSDYKASNTVRIVVKMIVAPWRTYHILFMVAQHETHGKGPFRYRYCKLTAAITWATRFDWQQEIFLYSPSHRPDIIYHSFIIPVVEHWLKWDTVQWVYHDGYIQWSIAHELQSSSEDRDEMEGEIRVPTMTFLLAVISAWKISEGIDLGPTVHGAEPLHHWTLAVFCSAIKEWDVALWESVCAHHAMGQNDPSWLNLWTISRSYHSHGMCSPVCVMVHIKEPMLIKKSSPFTGFSRFMSGSLFYVRCHITIYKMYWVHHLTKHFLPEAQSVLEEDHINTF